MLNKTQQPTLARQSPIESSNHWKIILVNKDPTIYQKLQSLFSDFIFEDKSLLFISAYCDREAKQLINANPDFALIILNFSGKKPELELVDYIRQTLNIKLARIILLSLEETIALSTVCDYEINFWLKTQGLTEQELATSIITNLRAYRDIASVEYNRQKWENSYISLQRFNRNLDQLVKVHTQELEEKNQCLEKEVRISEASRAALEKIEEELRKSEERWQLVLRGNNDGIWDWNIKTNESFLSLRSKEMLGYEDREISNHHQEWVDLLHPDDRDWVMKLLQDHLDRKTPYFIAEYRLRCKDGSYKWILSRGQALWDEAGTPTRVVGSSTDITERKQRKEALQLIVEGTAATTGCGFFRSCTRYLAEVLEVRYALVAKFANRGKTRVRTLAFWQGDRWGENFEYDLTLPAKECELFEKRCYYSESTQALFRENPELAKLNAQSYFGIPVVNSSGNVLGYLAVLDDKPLVKDAGKELVLKIFAARVGAELERLLAEQALKKQADKDNLLSNISRQFIDQDLGTAIAFTLQALGRFTSSDNSYIIHYCSSQNQWRVTHEWCEAGITRHHTQVLPVDDYPWFHQQLLKGKPLKIDRLDALPPEAASEKVAWASQSIQSMLIVPMINVGKAVGYLGLDAVDSAREWKKDEIGLLKIVGEFIAIAQARHQAEEALRQAKEVADAANRAKSEFLASISHELRTPLNAILGFTQVMNREPSLTNQQQQYLNIISRSGEHLLSLINDILDMSKIEAGRTTFNCKSFDLYFLLDSLEEMLRLRAQAKGLQLIFERTSDVPQYVQTDEGKLRQVLINLLGNAIKFADRGGVSLRVKAVNPTQLLFEVEDTGPGIALQEIDQLFEAFQQTTAGRNLQQGTGLGLTISRKFVELMGGEISVSSQLGKGSIFSFDIQVHPARASEVEPNKITRKVVGLEPDQPQYRILVVDDRLESRLLLVKLLSSLGFLIQEAINGQEAIELWQCWSPHLILMDMRMPVIDGYEATHRIKTTTKGQATIIIALTASAFEEERSVILSAGCDDFVRKPFREDILLTLIAQHLGVRYVYEEIAANSRSASAAPSLAPRQPTSPGEDSLDRYLRQMPANWIAQLNEAAAECSDDRIFELIEQIPDDGTLAIVLRDLASNFLFENILKLTQRLLIYQ